MLILPVDALALEDSWNYSIGVSVKQLSLDVYASGASDPLGVLTEDYSFMPELGVDSDITYLQNGAWGYKYAISFGGFEMTSQEVNLDDVNLGTSASGYYLYAMPVAVYDFNKGRANNALILGLGVGVGYLDASGDIIFTEVLPQVKHDFDFSEFSFSYGLFFEHEIDSWSYSVSLYGPEVSRGGYEYNLFDFALTLRKKFRF